MKSDLDILPLPNGVSRLVCAPTQDFFQWEIFKSFLEGVSPIDLTTFPIASLEAAEDFLRQYGVDLDDPLDQREAQDVYGESVEYLHRVLCPAPARGDVSLILPLEMTEMENLPRLLLVASQEGPMQPWACALLRLMHTINHANHAARSPFYTEIKEQILGRYRQHLRQTDGRHYLGHGDDAVPLQGVFFREEKSRESTILKLLHKPDNVAQSVFDRIGVKLVVKSAAEALMVLRYFRSHNLAIFANITPGRSRNTLIDLEQFQEEWWARRGDERPELALDQLRLRTFAPSTGNGRGGGNPHSSPVFRSIQFTCRQLIRLENPIHIAIDNLSRQLDQKLGREASQPLLTELWKHSQEKTLRFFFPYEVQILDEENYNRSETGDSSHANYRLRQLRSARRRVLGPLMLSRDNRA